MAIQLLRLVKCSSEEFCERLRIEARLRVITTKFLSKSDFPCMFFDTMSSKVPCANPPMHVHLESTTGKRRSLRMPLWWGQRNHVRASGVGVDRHSGSKLATPGRLTLVVVVKVGLTTSSSSTTLRLDTCKLTSHISSLEPQSPGSFARYIATFHERHRQRPHGRSHSRQLSNFFRP